MRPLPQIKKDTGKKQELVPELTEAVKRLHPADVCEVIVTELSSKLGAKDYLNWVRTQTGGSALEE